jgi:hypothetical protein
MTADMIVEMIVEMSVEMDGRRLPGELPVRESAELSS